MKTSFCIIAIAAITLFTSCKKDTVSDPTPTPPIVVLPATTITGISANAGAKGLLI